MTGRVVHEVLIAGNAVGVLTAPLVYAFGGHWYTLAVGALNAVALGLLLSQSKRWL